MLGRNYMIRHLLAESPSHSGILINRQKRKLLLPSS